MFNNKTKDSNPVTVSNIIGQGSHLRGDISTTGNLRVEGKITGSIQTKAKVVLSHTAQLQGNIVAHNAEVGGEVKGTIEVKELLILKSTAVVLGDLVATKLVFEEGAYFDGKCKMCSAQQKELIVEEKSNALAGGVFSSPQEAKEGDGEGDNPNNYLSPPGYSNQSNMI